MNMCVTWVKRKMKINTHNNIYIYSLMYHFKYLGSHKRSDKRENFIKERNDIQDMYFT